MLTAVKCITVLTVVVWSELGVGLHHLRRSEALHSILHSKAGKSVLNRSCGASLYADLLVDQIWHPRNYAIAIISAAQPVIERKCFLHMRDSPEAADMFEIRSCIRKSAGAAGKTDPCGGPATATQVLACRARLAGRCPVTADSVQA